MFHSTRTKHGDGSHVSLSKQRNTGTVLMFHSARTKHRDGSHVSLSKQRNTGTVLLSGKVKTTGRQVKTGYNREQCSRDKDRTRGWFSCLDGEKALERASEKTKEPSLCLSLSQTW